ncbi:MAG: hypothetical protein ACTTJ9_04490 [Segatella oris]
MAETLFLLFFTLRPWPKVDFLHFFTFGRGGKSVFVVFSVSAAAEMLFLLFSTHPPWRKVDFCRFFSFSRGGKLIFTIFLVSSTDDE